MRIPKRAVLPVAVLAAFGPAAFAAMNAPAASADTAPDCRPLVIGVGGAQERYMESQGQVTPIVQQLAYYGAQGNRTENTDYESSIWPEGPYSHDASVADGTAKVEAEISGYRSQCPAGKVTVVGHSLGTEVADNVASKADHVVVYGDPDHGKGVFSQLPGIFPGASNRGITPVPANETDTCHQYDWVCDAPQPWTDPVGFGLAVQGYLSGNHYYAPGEDKGTAEGTERYVPQPSPNPNIPQSTPTGIPAAPLPLPKLAPMSYGPLPSLQDVQPLVDAVSNLPALPAPPALPKLPALPAAPALTLPKVPAPALPNVSQMQAAVSNVVAQVQKAVAPAPAPVAHPAAAPVAKAKVIPARPAPAPAVPNVAQVQKAVNAGVQNATVQVHRTAAQFGIKLP